MLQLPRTIGWIFEGLMRINLIRQVCLNQIILLKTCVCENLAKKKLLKYEQATPISRRRRMIECDRLQAGILV